MQLLSGIAKKLAVFGIAALCFGYFASYVPYSMMTKMITRGFFTGMNGVGFTGVEIQPMAIVAGFIAIYIIITIAGWWKYATHFNFLGFSIPRPRWFTVISGVCTSSQIITTTLAYTFSGVSIVFAMLLMRGGVLVIAPIVDTIVKKRKRNVYWPSWVASALSMGALLVAFMGNGGSAMTIVCAIDIIIYLVGYFFRLYMMSTFAKSSDYAEKMRYYVEEQLIAMPLLLVSMFVIALFGVGSGRESVSGQLWWGFVGLPRTPYLIHTLLIGLFSQGTGIFGTLIYLDKRENTFTVPANRSSSVIAGLIATYALAIFYGQSYPDFYQLLSVGMILFAIVFLAYRAWMDKKSAKGYAAAAVAPAEK